MGRIGWVLLLLAAAPAHADVLAASGLISPPVLIVEETPGKPTRTPLVLRVCPQGECVDVESAQLSARVKFERSDVGWVLDAEVEWHKIQWLHRIAVELALGPGKLQVVGRDDQLHVVKKAFLGRFDPKWVSIGDKTVVSDDDIDELAVEARSNGTVITVELDSATARPFTHDAHCSRKWQDPNRHIPVPLRLRVPGEKITARLQLAHRTLTPLVKSPWPDGRRAALVFTDHADQTTLRTLLVLAHGFAAHHLVFTKALFSKGADRPQLDDPRMVELADEMWKSGSEIVPHSATPRPDDRQVTSQALERFLRWKARTWIDHQPETNCEAFGDEGYMAGGKFGIADLLASHQYEYVWAEVDAPPGDLNLLSPAHLEQRAPTLWPLGRVSLGGPSTLWMFRTMWAFLEANRFYAMYGAPALDKLEKERGLHLAHTYLDTFHKRGTKFGLRNVIVPAQKSGVPGGPGELKLDPRMEALLQRLQQRQERGTLWVPTLAELADRMRQIAAVTITVRQEGSFVVHADQPVKAASFVLLRPAAVLVDGKSVKSEEGFVVDLPAGDTAIELQAP